jgi:GAF domain-containing protein
MQVIVEMLNQALKTDWTAIFSNQPDNHLEILAFKGSLNPNDEQTSWLRDSSIVKSCFREGKPVANKLLSVSAKGEFLEEYAFPIHYSGEILAVLHIGALNTNFMDENDYEIIGALANTVGGIMTTSRLIDQIRIQALRQKQLFEVSSKIRRFVDIESILRTSAEEIGKTLQVRSAKVKITTALPETDNELAERRLIRDENGDAKL